MRRSIGNKMTGREIFKLERSIPHLPAVKQRFAVHLEEFHGSGRLHKSECEILAGRRPVMNFLRRSSGAEATTSAMFSELYTTLVNLLQDFQNDEAL